MEIEKCEFEAFLAVATSAHCEVYEKVEPHFMTAYDDCKACYLAEVGTQAAEGTQHPKLTECVKRWVSLSAFLSVFRQLDLVLTPTGFGVVQNNQVAPASKQRVDALIGQLRDALLTASGMLLEELCKVSEWGDTYQAAEQIDTLFYDIRLMTMMHGPAVSHLDWQEAQPRIGEADEMLRLRMSPEYMDELLDHVRHDQLTADDRPIIFLCRHIISLWIAGDHKTIDLKMRRLVNTLDADLEKYATYAQYGYPVNHHETFQNTQDSPAYVF